MRMIAISSNLDIHTGFKLAGVECHLAKAADELPVILGAIQSVENIGIMAVSDEFINLEPMKNFLEGNPQILHLAVSSNWNCVG